jgi:hypothetical protein
MFNTHQAIAIRMEKQYFYFKKCAVKACCFFFKHNSFKSAPAKVDFIQNVTLKVHKHEIFF